MPCKKSTENRSSRKSKLPGKNFLPRNKIKKPVSERPVFYCFAKSPPPLFWSRLPEVFSARPASFLCLLLGGTERTFSQYPPLSSPALFDFLPKRALQILPVKILLRRFPAPAVSSAATLPSLLPPA